jgi:hypothetical protein
MEPPETRYAKGGTHIAYQVLSSGPLDLILVLGSFRTSSWLGKTRTEPDFYPACHLLARDLI